MKMVVNCSIYSELYELPRKMFTEFIDEIEFRMEKTVWIQSDELTLLRCLFDLAVGLKIVVTVIPPKDPMTRNYAEGMGLFKGFNIPGHVFNNHILTSYIPLTKVVNDKNHFLETQFTKIFSKMNIPATNVPFICLAFTEIADNIYYHSGDKDDLGWGYLHGQLYKNKVKITFTDVGVGFMGAYERSGTVNNRTNVQLLTDSLQSMQSRLNLPGKKATRGIGLYEAADLVKNTHGTLVLKSLNSMVSLYGSRVAPIPTTSWTFYGSQISMSIPI